MGQNHKSSNKLVVIGSVGAPFGVKGWLKVNSYTDPKENILHFKQWYLVDKEHHLAEQLMYTVLEAKESQDRFVVLFNGIKDRFTASNLTNKKIAIDRKDLPELSANQYYWADLIGSMVYDLSGKLLGCLDHIFTTVANDVMVVKQRDTQIGSNSVKEYLIPYKLGEFVVNIDLTNKKIIVNWDVE